MKFWIAAFLISIPFGLGGLVLVFGAVRFMWWLLVSAKKELEGTRLIGEQYITPLHAIGRFFKF